ncbi:MAG: hypothetical protein A2017_01880 [Lentisphaerae bacterium GWF2_44_16]|nr:MAG: hypothetical protein A2017_01880 [Lentisphaerae bacterium GWF2_44_16]
MNNLGENFKGVLNFMLKRSVAVKIILIGFLIFILQIPTYQIINLINERQSMKVKAVEEICSKWGKSQTLTGPFLVVPFQERVLEGKEQRERIVKHWITILPETLSVNGNMQPEIRKRGIYQAVLFSGKFTLTGTFILPETSEISGLKPQAEILWNNAIIVFGVSDIIGLKENILKIDGSAIRTIPGMPGGLIANIGFHVPYSLKSRLPSGTSVSNVKIPFCMELGINGSSDINFYPLGRETTVSTASSWNSPSFCGKFLPNSREITDKGFKAEWKISDMNRNYPQVWIDGESKINDSSFGVGFYVTANIYQQSFRAAKYAVLFIVFTMLAFLFAESFAKTWMHPIQYFLVGLAIVMFYSLLLSFAEHISFAQAYLFAALAVVLLVSAYCGLIFRLGKMAVSVGAAMTLAYALLYLVLQMEDYALLAGSICFFVLLAVLMFFTRGINRKSDDTN